MKYGHALSQHSLTEASNGCRALNMSLIAFQSISSMQDYLPFLQSSDAKRLSHILHISTQHHFISAESHSLTSFWTSASSSSAGGLLCGVERTFVWCSTGNIVDETIITDSQLRNYSGFNGNESTANCVTFGLNDGRARLSLASCSEAKPFMCQVKSRKLLKSLWDHSYFYSPNARLQLVQKTA
jgi:hypothetical protein